MAELHDAIEFGELLDQLFLDKDSLNSLIDALTRSLAQQIAEPELVSEIVSEAREESTRRAAIDLLTRHCRQHGDSVFEALVAATVALRPTHEKLLLFVRKRFPHLPRHAGGGKESIVCEDAVPSFEPAPVFEPDERLVIRFVGRADDVDRVLTTVRRQKTGQKSRPKPGTSLFWFHGFGGMGKSWLLRRLAYTMSRAGSRKARSDCGEVPSSGVLLVDWNPQDLRWGVRAAASEPVGLFRSIAIRATQVFGGEPFKQFWADLAIWEQHSGLWNELSCRFHMALNSLTKKPESTGVIGEAGPDRFAIRVTTPQGEQDALALKEVLQAMGFWPSDPKERTARLGRIERPSAERDEAYEKWAAGIAPAIPHRELLARPYSALAEVLRIGLDKASRIRPVFLLLDTCEFLDEWTDGWLRKLLVPLLAGSSPMVVAIGSRSRPDRYHVSGGRGGWLDELAGRIVPVPFDRDRHFTVSEVAELLRRSKVSMPGTDLDNLAEKLHVVTRGFPLSLGLLTGMYSDLLQEILALEDLGGPELNSSKAARRVAEEVAARFLSHVADREDRDDIIALTILPAVTDDPDSQWDLEYRFRPSWNHPPQRLESFRDDVLAALWGDLEWRRRLRTLEQRYALVGDGDLHPTVRYYFRSDWRLNPPDGLEAVVDRLAAALERIRPAEGVYDQNWVAWSAFRIGIDRWIRPKAVPDRLMRAAAIGEAHGLDISEIRRVAFEFSNIESWPWESSERIPSLPPRWEPVEEACFALLAGLRLSGKVGSFGRQSSKEEPLLVEAIQLFERALEPLWPTLPTHQQRRISAAYLECVTRVTLDTNHPDILQRAVGMAEKLPLPPGGLWWAMLLHNQGLYEASSASLSTIIEENTAEPYPVLVLSHNLAHHQDRPEDALAALDRGLDLTRQAPMLLKAKAELLGDLDRVDEGIQVLESFFETGNGRGHGAFSFQPVSRLHVALGKLYQRAGRLEEAEVELKKLLPWDEENDDAMMELAPVLAKLDKIQDCRTVSESVLKGKAEGTPEWAERANDLAWRLYLAGACLDMAEDIAGRALKVVPSDGNVLQTLMAIQGRAGRWEASEPHVRRYLREYPPDKLFGHFWRDDLLFLRDALKAQRGQWLANLIEEECPKPLDPRWEVVLLALANEEDPPELLREAVEDLTGQLQSDASAGKFPAIPDCTGTSTGDWHPRLSEERR